MKYRPEFIAGALVNTVLLIAAALAVLTASGCYARQFENVEKARALRVGMTKDQVLEIMGEPEEHVLYASPDQWFYFIRSRWHDGQVTEDECLPVIFENDRVIGWGNAFFARYRLEERHLFRSEYESDDEEDAAGAGEESGSVSEPEASEPEASEASDSVAGEPDDSPEDVQL